MWNIWYRFPKKGDLKCTDLSNDRIEILGIHFSCNKKVQMKNNYITTIRSSFVKFTYAYPWGEGSNITFKTLAISKTDIDKYCSKVIVIVKELQYIYIYIYIYI